MQVGDLLHAEPAELAAAHSAGHVIAAPVVHLDDVSSTAWAGLYIVCYTHTHTFFLQHDVLLLLI